MDELRANDPNHPIWGVNGSLEQSFQDHPIRALALDPNVKKLRKDGAIVEVWGTPEQMPWRFRKGAVH